MRFADPFRRRANAADPGQDTAQEKPLRHALQSAYAAENASPALRERVSGQATLHAQQTVMLSRHRSISLKHCLLQMGAGAVCGGAILVVLAWPNIKTACILYRMQSAIAHARTVSVYTRYTFKPESTGTIKPPSMTVAVSWTWIQSGQWHIESSIDWNAYFDGSHLNFRDNPMLEAAPIPPTHHVTVTDTSTPPTHYQWAGGISLKASPADTAMSGMFSQLIRQREETLNGHRAIVYAWKPYFAYARTMIWLDAQDYAPVQVEVEEEHKGRSVWKRYAVTRFDLDQPPRNFL